MSFIKHLLVLSSIVIVISAWAEAQTYNSTSNRIHGGREARPGQFPYQVSLRERKGGKYVHVCGGSILSKRFVLTAAHCLELRTTPLYILVGGHNRDVVDRKDIYNISRVFIHENFSSTTLENDIGLLRVEKAIQFSKTVRAIPLHQEFLYGDVNVTTSGWGETNVSTTCC